MSRPERWEPNSTLRLAAEGTGGELARIAAEATIALARMRERRGRRITGEWVSRTYLEAIQLLERRDRAGNR